MKPWLMAFLMVFAMPCMSGQRVLLVLGDSLSAAFGIAAEKGWVALLQQRLQQEGMPWLVVNAGISGDTTAGGVARLEPLLRRHQPAIVILELGSNDGLRGFAFRQIRANLERLIEQTRAAGAQPLLVGGMLPPNYGADYADAFHQVYLSVAAEKQVPLVPFLLAGVAQDRSLMLADGYHPNEQAQPILLDTVWPHLQPLLAPPTDPMP
jgi:acyl-CoA thioesterase-1